MFRKPHSVEKAMFVVMAVLFGLSLIERNPVLVFHSTLGLTLSGYLLGAAKQHSSARR